MRRTFLIAALALFAPPAVAADLVALKAPPAAFGATGSGWYGGIGGEAVIAQSSASGNNLLATSLISGNLRADGGAIKGIVGWISPKFLVEASLGYSNITGSGVVAGSNASVVSRWSASQEVGINFSALQYIVSVLPNLGLTNVFPSFTPSLPANVLAAAPRQILSVGFREFGVDGSFGSASGSSWSAAPMVKNSFLWQSLDANGKATGGAIKQTIWAAFPMRGISFANVFASGGAPLTLNSGVNMGTQYGTSIEYLIAF